MNELPDGPGDISSTQQSQYLRAMQELTSAMAAGGSTFEERVEPVLAVGREHLGFPKGFVSCVTEDEHRVVASTAQDEAIPVGVTAPLGETFCRLTLSNGDTTVLPDPAETHPDDPAQDRFDLRAYVGTVLRTQDGSYGTLCYVNESEPLESFSEWQEALFEHLSQWVEAEIERELAVERREQSQRLLEATFNSPETFIGILDADGTLIRANETALAFIDVTEAEVAGEAVWETPWWDHDADVQAQCRDAVERAAAGETVRFESEHIGADGTRISAAVVARPIVSDDGIQKLIIEGTDITDLKRREEQMEFFNSILRHDILNGMNVIEARAEMLSDTLDESRAGYAETILDWSRDIVDLTQKIRTVLDTVSDGGLTDAEAVELAPVVESEASRARSMADGCTIQTDIADDTAVVAGELLSDVVGNILTNAVEHGGPAPTISVTATRDGGMVELRVADDGPGIPPDDRDDIFEKGESGRESTGTGFGLYFVAVMVEGYGGDIWVEESDLGGSEFVVTLPAA